MKLEFMLIISNFRLNFNYKLKINLMNWNKIYNILKHKKYYKKNNQWMLKLYDIYFTYE